jgi:hypothetical protein
MRARSVGVRSVRSEPHTEARLCCNSDVRIAFAHAWRPPRVHAPQLACGECNPYAVHLYKGVEKTDPDGYIPLLCKKWCNRYFNACNADLNLAANFCDIHGSDDYYCYPVNDQV